MKRAIFYLTTLLLINGQSLFGQENLILSLEECVKLAVERNINTRTARIEQEKSEHKIAESKSALLPKINVNGSFQDNFELPVTLLPGEIIGQPGTQLAASIGTTFNTNLAANFNMVLFNQTARTALKLSKELAELSGLNVEKASETLAEETAKLYYLTITTIEQKSLLENNISRTKQLQDITKLLVDNGIGKQVDYDRICVSIENLYTQLSSVDAAYEQQINMMKYMLDLPLSTTITLTGKAELPLIDALPAWMSDFSEHPDIKILEQQKEVNGLNMKAIKDGYLPTLSLTGQFAYQGMRDEFGDYFKNNDANKWYSSSYIGVSVSVPIFDGFEKRSKSRQAKLDYQKTEMQLEDTKDHFMADYKNAMNNYQNNLSNVQRQKQNIGLATRVYDETALRYKEGMASMSDLLQDEMSLNSAQSSYLTALYNFKEAELQLMSLNGNIRNLIKN